jgi:hypothetical protein
LDQPFMEEYYSIQLVGLRETMKVSGKSGKMS